MKPTLNRMRKKAFDDALPKVDNEWALKRNEPGAAMETPRQHVAAAIERQAAGQPPIGKTVRQANHGNFREP